VNPLRLAVGTLTVYPTPPPRIVDRRVAGWAMALAPLVSAALTAPLWLGAELVHERWAPLVIAAVWVALLALLTRGMHLDGLADTADGLGSGRPADGALEVMRRGDVGPFGVAALVLVLVVQVAAAAQLLSADHGGALVATAVVTSRLCLPLLCSVGVPSARTEGLGATVAGTVGGAQLLVAAGVTLTCLLTVALVSDETPWLALGGLLPGLALGWWCVRRLGGVSGDVLGACVEVTFAAALLSLCLG
jgi:adenosylcobinamide-GDP ribazoletransferase